MQLSKRKDEILEAWMQFQLQDVTLHHDLISREDLRKQTDEILTSFIKAINSDVFDIESPQYDSIKETLMEICLYRAKQGFTVRETGVYVLSLKKAINKSLHEQFKDPAELYDAMVKISDLLDSLTIFTFETFIQGREAVILRQTDEITEISTPVIRVWDKVVALPIIGTLDSARTQVVMENLLNEIVNTGSSIAILDISGVPAVDSLVAQHLMKTVSATRLMGAECIISGIRAEIAQTIVHLGIDLSGIKTKATLAGALQLAFSMLNYEIKKKSQY